MTKFKNLLNEKKSKRNNNNNPVLKESKSHIVSDDVAIKEYKKVKKEYKDVLQKLEDL